MINCYTHSHITHADAPPGIEYLVAPVRPLSARVKRSTVGALARGVVHVAAPHLVVISLEITTEQTPGGMRIAHRFLFMQSYSHTK